MLDWVIEQLGSAKQLALLSASMVATVFITIILNMYMAPMDPKELLTLMLMVMVVTRVVLGAVFQYFESENNQ